MRTRAEVETEMLDVMADIHRCDEAREPVGAELARLRLDDLQVEWATIPEQRTDAHDRAVTEQRFHHG